LDLFLTEGAPEDLADHAFGKVAAELDLGGHFVRGEMLSEVGLELIRSRSFTILEHDVYLDALSLVGIRDADGDSFLDLGVLVDQLINLTREDVGTPTVIPSLTLGCW
jgi:hypothetical protein